MEFVKTRLLKEYKILKSTCNEFEKEYKRYVGIQRCLYEEQYEIEENYCVEMRDITEKLEDVADDIKIAKTEYENMCSKVEEVCKELEKYDDFGDIEPEFKASNYKKPKNQLTLEV